MVNIARGILSAITYCHYNLRTVIGNLNPDGIVCDFSSKEYHTRIVNFSQHFEAPYKYVRQRIHKLNLERITPTRAQAPVNYSAFFLAPEQVLFGLALDTNVEVHARDLSQQDPKRRKTHKDEIKPSKMLSFKCA